MTEEEIKSLPISRKTDMIIAEKVLGWKKVRRQTLAKYSDEEALFESHIDYCWTWIDSAERERLKLPEFSRKIEDAWVVWSTVIEYHLIDFTDNLLAVTAEKIYGKTVYNLCWYLNPIMICRAALLTINNSCCGKL